MEDLGIDLSLLGQYQASMAVFPDTMYSGRFKIDNFFQISNFCHSIQIIQVLHAWIQRGDQNTSYMGLDRE